MNRNTTRPISPLPKNPSMPFERNNEHLTPDPSKRLPKPKLERSTRPFNDLKKPGKRQMESWKLTI
jgi:hypothetical protein